MYVYIYRYTYIHTYIHTYISLHPPPPSPPLFRKKKLPCLHFWGMAVNRLVHSHAPSTCAGYHEQSRAGKSKRWMSTSSRKYSRNLKAAPYANICVGSQM